MCGKSTLSSECWRGENRVVVKWKGYNSASNSWIPLSDPEQLWITTNSMLGSLEPTENNPLLPCGKTTVIFNLLLQPNWLDYNHLYVFGKSLHQQEYKMLQIGFEAGLCKQQISDVFAKQEAPCVENISLTAIHTFSCFTQWKDKSRLLRWLPEYSRSMQKNLLLLDDCFLGKQNKAEAYYTQGRHNCDTIYMFFSFCFFLFYFLYFLCIIAFPKYFNPN